MRVCPKCGHKEFIWKHLQHARFTDYCHINELQLEHYHLSLKVKKSPKFYTDGLFNYRLVSAGFVYRIWRDDAETPNSIKEPDMEKPKNLSPFALKITRPKLPSKEIIAPMIKTVLKEKSELMDKMFGKYKWRHWIRTDDNGFSYPTEEDWRKVLQYIETPKELDEMILFVRKERQQKLILDS